MHTKYKQKYFCLCTTQYMIAMTKSPEGGNRGVVLRVYITGFGPISGVNGVAHNPTQEIVEDIGNRLCKDRSNATRPGVGERRGEISESRSTDDDAKETETQQHILSELTQETVVCSSVMDKLQDNGMRTIDETDKDGSGPQKGVLAHRAGDDGIEVVGAEVLEVSAGAVEDRLDTIHSHLLSVKDKSIDGGRCILVHAGVKVGATEFSLERCAFNEANFKVPDQRNYHPHNEVISSGCLSQLRCPLPLEDICKTLSSSGFPCVVSDDPGRFVCNYI
eukprot:GHVQ01019239.1.p2 GENE.GHVQ01019239.1~~GHVQ01019239.1.p2  ORF type:complete len:277 (-),score=43.85 GHVQ01019239.1:4950-5780(-)